MDRILFNTINYILGGLVGAYIFKSCEYKWGRFFVTQLVIFVLILILRYFVK